MQPDTSDSPICKWWPRHNTLVTSSRRPCDQFRLRFWVRCWSCELGFGPYRDRESALLVARYIEHLEARSG